MCIYAYIYIIFICIFDKMKPTYQDDLLGGLSRMLSDLGRVKRRKLTTGLIHYYNNMLLYTVITNILLYHYTTSFYYTYIIMPLCTYIITIMSLLPLLHHTFSLALSHYLLLGYFIINIVCYYTLLLLGHYYTIALLHSTIPLLLCHYVLYMILLIYVLYAA